MTKYKVLVWDDESKGWQVLAAESETHGPQQSMRKAAEGLLQDDLERGVKLAAVPVSNWTEEYVKLAPQKPRLVIGGEQQTLAVVPEPEPEREREEVTSDGA